MNKLRGLVNKAVVDPSSLLQEETETIVTQELVQLITKGLPGAHDMDDEAKINLALDTLLAIELRNWIRRNLQVEVGLLLLVKEYVSLNASTGADFINPSRVVFVLV